MSPSSLPTVLAALLLTGAGQIALAQPAGTEASRNSRIRLVGFQPGFLCEMPWLEDESSTGDPESWETTPTAPPDELDWINFSAGNDNPYFDLRQRGEPGGVGFARVNTQVQLLDTERTAFALGVSAITPLGLENEGLADEHGPTVLTPALAVFHALTDATAVQAFVGKNVPLMNSAGRSISRHVQCGLAVQRPISTETSAPLSSLYLSLGALGQIGPERESVRRDGLWEVLPGLHWQPTETWWLSAGYAVPVGPARNEAGSRWQLTCSWQY